jgi:DsbC/DsbD-like thiol-disulfide interchange protein/cytochrome c biogenesis protein CcdA
MRALFLLLLLLPGIAFGAVSNSAITSRDTLSLISETNSATDGKITLALHFQMAPGWHIYWSNPGDAGLPPQITFAPPAAAGPFAYPAPEFLLQSGVAAYVLSGDVVLPFAATGVGDQVTANANWLVCNDICVPEHANFILPLAGGASAEAALFKGPEVVPSPFAARISPDGVLTVEGLGRAQVAAARFFPAAPGIIVNNAPQQFDFSSNNMRLRLKMAAGFDAAKPLVGVLELTDPSGAMQAVEISAAPGPAAVATPIWVWLALALLGGLILNLMPCVFPILAMKALSLCRLGDAHRRDIRREAGAYTAGVLVAMLIVGALLLGLRALGAEIGWGFQLQSPVFIAAMALLILAVALNLAGLFEVAGMGWLGARLAGQGSFFTGLLAVAVATPCTAPFMGGAIAAALATPLAVGLAIFLCLGLGLAAPFAVIAAVPRLAAFLPRPGRWMKLLQRALSIPMFATFLWLGWVFSQQVLPARAAITLPGAQPYAAARLADLRAAGTPVFVDMTAAWCITCLVNARDALGTPAVQAAFARTGTQLLVGDWTSRDPAITAYLQQNQRDGVPLYVFYPAHGAPVVLPQILTPGVVVGVVR